MTYSMLRSNFDGVVNAIKAMLMAQDALHQAWKLGYTATDKLAIANQKRQAAAQLLKELLQSQPKVVEASIVELNKEYTAFLTRCQYLGAAQQKYFDNTKDAKLKKAYQYQVNDMTARIKKYFQNTYNNQSQQLAFT